MHKVKDLLLPGTGLSLVLGILLLVSGACVVDPSFPLSVQNKSGQMVSVTINSYPFGELAPDSDLTGGSLYHDEYSVEATNQSGIVVFRRIVTLDQLEGRDPKWPYPKWTIVITENVTPAPTPTMTSERTEDVHNFWIEDRGVFFTNDIARAQTEIPFRIVLPSYFPAGSGGLWRIVGPLKSSQAQLEKGIEIGATYIFGTDRTNSWSIRVTEWDYPVTSGDPKLNPGLEVTELHGTVVTFTTKEHVPWGPWYYSFSKNRVWFEVVFNVNPDIEVPFEEQLKVVESMLR